MSNSSRLSKMLVIGQFIFVSILLIDYRNSHFGATMMALMAVTLAVWAFISMRKQFSVFPEPKPSRSLIRSGPYRFIRHPMYTALLIWSLGRVLFLFTTTNLFGFLGLTTILALKIQHEEKLLSKSFKDYDDYRKTTKRLVPFLY